MSQPSALGQDGQDSQGRGGGWPGEVAGAWAWGVLQASADGRPSDQQERALVSGALPERGGVPVGGVSGSGGVQCGVRAEACGWAQVLQTEQRQEPAEDQWQGGEEGQGGGAVANLGGWDFRVVVEAEAPELQEFFWEEQAVRGGEQVRPQASAQLVQVEHEVGGRG